MAILAKDEGGTFIPAPEGQFQAVCCDVVDMGNVQTTWEGKTRSVHKIRIVFQLDELGDDNKPFMVSQWLTLSLGEKANLRKFLESWRGKKFTGDELRDGFDVEKLVAANALLQVVHNAKGEKVYANIQSIMKAPKGAQPMAPKDYIRVKDRPTDTPQTPSNGTAQSFPAALVEEDDDLPF